MPKDPEKRLVWEKNIGKGRKDFKASDYQVVCSNHFQYGEPTYEFPNPILYLVPSDDKKSLPVHWAQKNYYTTLTQTNPPQTNFI